MPTSSRLFMNFSNASIKGESSDTQYAEQVEITSWDWNFKRNDDKDGMDAGRCEPSVFSFCKPLDKSSPQLLNRFLARDRVNATLTLLEAPVSDSDLPFKVVVELRRVRLVEYSISGKDEEKSSQIEEDWTVNYDEIRFQHSSLDPSTGKTKTVDSAPIKRSARASKASANASKKVADDFIQLSPNSKMSAATKIAEDKDSVETFKKIIKQ